MSQPYLDSIKISKNEFSLLWATNLSANFELQNEIWSHQLKRKLLTTNPDDVECV